MLPVMVTSLLASSAIRFNPATNKPAARTVINLIFFISNIWFSTFQRYDRRTNLSVQANSAKNCAGLLPCGGGEQFGDDKLKFRDQFFRQHFAPGQNLFQRQPE